MNRIFKLLGLVALAAYFGARLRRRSSAPTHTDDSFGVSPSTEDAPGFGGLSAVDPEPLTQFGEAVDPEALRAAHAEPALLRGRLPLPGKNLP